MILLKIAGWFTRFLNMEVIVPEKIVTVSMPTMRKKAFFVFSRRY